MSAHTPGPWAVETGYSRTGGAQVAVVNSDHLSRTGCCICLVSPVATISAEDSANARLIAAAPEMLAALKHIRAVTGRMVIPTDEARIAAVKQANAAIAKAEGRAQ